MNFNQRRLFFALLQILIMAILMSACSILPKEQEVLGPKLKEPPKIQYDTLEVKKGSIERKVECTGDFISVSQSDLSFKFSGGRLKKIYVKVGDKIKKGTLLAELDTDTIEKQIKQQEIAVKKQKVSYENLKSNGLKQYNAGMLKLKSLKKHLEDMKSVEGVYSKAQIQELQEQISMQEVDCDSALATYNTNLQLLECDIQSSTLQFDNLKSEYEKSRLISPIDGTVDYIISSNEGDFVDAYKTVVRVADPTDLQLQYSDNKVSEFELGNKVEITIGGNKYVGETVMTPSNMPVDADEKTRRSIRIKVEKLPPDTIIGDNASIKLIKEKKDNVIVIPKNVVHTLNGRKYILILENEIRKERDIEIGIENVTEVEVVKGLEEGEKVVK